MNAESGGLPPAGWSHSPIPVVAWKGRIQRPFSQNFHRPTPCDPAHRGLASALFCLQEGRPPLRPFSFFLIYYYYYYYSYFGLPITMYVCWPCSLSSGGAGCKPVSATLSYSVLFIRCSRPPIKEQRRKRVRKRMRKEGRWLGWPAGDCPHARTRFFSVSPPQMGTSILGWVLRGRKRGCHMAERVRKRTVPDRNLSRPVSQPGRSGLCCGCPMPCQVFSSIPGLHP